MKKIARRPCVFGSFRYDLETMLLNVYKKDASQVKLRQVNELDLTQFAKLNKILWLESFPTAE